MIDVKPTMLARTFDSAWLSAMFANYQVDKSYYALDFSKENDARDAIDQLSPAA
ncbi:hypothetical protein I6I87_00145 [Moraxella osloensis]|nr:hypothetical protein [Moraxella osloensis]QQU06563.1 hypothetical protein I6I87_00145 [Moraxella osloensis]